MSSLMRCHQLRFLLKFGELRLFHHLQNQYISPSIQDFSSYRVPKSRASKVSEDFVAMWVGKS
jgi:hypothetical protein